MSSSLIIDTYPKIHHSYISPNPIISPLVQSTYIAIVTIAFFFRRLHSPLQLSLPSPPIAFPPLPPPSPPPHPSQSTQCPTASLHSSSSSFHRHPSFAHNHDPTITLYVRVIVITNLVIERDRHDSVCDLLNARVLDTSVN